MSKRSKGKKSRTRKKLKQRGRPTITKFLQKFNIGDRVVIKLEPSSQKGMPHPRYKGRIGTIIGKRGKSYILEVQDGKKLKLLISRPEHLKAAKL
jgi:large subunit ribosomal protein L21e